MALPEREAYLDSGLSPDLSVPCGNIISSGVSKDGFTGERSLLQWWSLAGVTHPLCWYHQLWYIEKIALPVTEAFSNVSLSPEQSSV